MEWGGGRIIMIKSNITRPPLHYPDKIKKWECDKLSQARLIQKCACNVIAIHQIRVRSAPTKTLTVSMDKQMNQWILADMYCQCRSITIRYFN